MSTQGNARGLIALIQQFKNEEVSSNVHTFNAKETDLRHFVQFLSAAHQVQPYKLTVQHLNILNIRAFIQDRVDKGEASTTINRRISTVKHLCNWLDFDVEPEGWRNPAVKVRNVPKPKLFRPDALVDEQRDRLKFAANQVGTSEFMNIRSRAIIEITLGTSMRPADLQKLKMRHLTNDCSKIIGLPTKFQRVRSYIIRSDVRIIIERWLYVRECELIERAAGYRNLSNRDKSEFPVFISFRESDISDPDSFRMNTKTIYRTFAGASSIAKLPEVAAARKCRHTFAHNTLDATKDIRLVSQLLGHSDIRTTMRYTERSEDQMAEQIEKTRRRRA
jgi:site-specific recombinase XerD